MPRKSKPLDRDNIIAAYQAGTSLVALKKLHGIHIRRIRAVLTDAGIPLRIQAEAHRLATVGIRKRTDVDEESVVAAYMAGHGMTAIGQTYKADRSVIERILRARNIHIRNARESRAATYHKLGRRGPRWNAGLDIDELTQKYRDGASMQDLAAEFGVHHDTIARRLRPLGVTRKGGEAMNREGIAKGRQRHRALAGRFEEEAIEMLAARGLQPVHQLAVGTRNIDVAIEPIAVEVWLSSLRPEADAYCRERIVDLADRGWHVAYVHISRRTEALSAVVADQLVSWFKLVERKPAMTREYRVIRGTGELVARGHVHPEYVPLVPAPIDSPDAV